MTSASQLYLLSDHIKLSLLERQRAISLNLEPSSQDSHISRSLDSLREGIEALEQSPTSNDQAPPLRQQYDDLTSQFRGFPSTSTPLSAGITQPNSPSLRNDFAAAQDRSRNPSSSLRKSTPSNRNTANSSSPHASKNVRFRDNDSDSAPDEQETATRAALFPYRDNPSDDDEANNTRPDPSQLDNTQIHAYHSNVLAEQDEQLDRLGVSIGRQRDLSIQIGDELDEQVEMLGEVDGHMDRTQGRLDGARAQLGKVARRAGENWGITTIVVLVVVLVFLIIVLKS